MLRVVWINKGQWLKPGPIVYIGLLNALSFAQNDIATDYFIGGERESVSDIQTDLEQFYGVQAHPKLTIRCIPNLEKNRRSVYTAAIQQICSYCQEGSDVIVLTRELGCLGSLLKLKKKYPQLKILHEAHDYYLSTRHLPAKNFAISSLRRQWAEKHLIPKVDGLICLTEHQRALYQQWMPTLPTIALSLGCLKFTAQTDFENRRLQKKVTYIGNLHGYKGLELIFSLAQQLKPRNIELHSFGGTPEEVALATTRADKELLTGTLFFKPFIEPKILHDILDTKMSLGLVPLQDTYYNRYLTCPVKALDFTSHGLPVVSSALPSLFEVLREHGHYCDPKNVSGYAEKIINLLEDAQLYAQASLGAYKRSTELQWRSRAKQILDFALTL